MWLIGGEQSAMIACQFAGDGESLLGSGRHVAFPTLVSCKMSLKRAPGFSHKMSLKGKIGMLGIDHQHGRFGSDEPGADPGVSGRQRRRCGLPGKRREEVYGWVEKTLVRHQYASLGRPGKGLVRRYLARMTGLSRAQVTRLITGYRQTGRVKAAAYQRTKFATRYTAADVDLLAYVDKAHGNLSGPATRRILEREYSEYGQAAYQRLAAISVAHLYRLRNSAAYRKRNTSYQPTRPTPIPIGERRKPQPHGAPGYLRIDTVHQGDQDGRKGLYHINAVDQVTQWEIVAATPQISELWLLPVLEAMLEQFPFVIRGFHSDNGSEFINYNVARLLANYSSNKPSRGRTIAPPGDGQLRHPQGRQGTSLDGPTCSIPSPLHSDQWQLAKPGRTAVC